MNNKINTKLAVMILLMFTSAFFIISGIGYTFIAPHDKWLWFSRIFAGCTLMGIAMCINPKTPLL